MCENKLGVFSVKPIGKLILKVFGVNTMKKNKGGDVNNC